MPYPGTHAGPHRGSRDPYTEDLSIQSRGAIATTSRRLACIWRIYSVSDIGTLSVVTARELVVLSRSFTCQSQSVRRLRHLRGHTSHEIHTVSNVEGRKVISTYFPRVGVEPLTADLVASAVPARLLRHF